MRKTTLILIPELSNCDKEDFLVIASSIRQLAPDIDVHVVKRRHLWWQQLRFLFRPTLYVAFYAAGNFRPLRGLCLRGKSIGKSRQYQLMETGGIEVIPWQTIAAGKTYQRDDWGDMVIVKPDHGREGRGVKLSRPEKIGLDELGNGNYLVQRFIETGDSPVYFRALTLFGEMLYLRKTCNASSSCNAHDKDDLPDPVANASHGNSVLVHDEEIMAFAKRIATTIFPDIPLLGQDIVRERSSGKLYCLEVNPYGSTWHFSTQTGLALQLRDGINYKSQYDAFAVAAKVLVRKTRELAR